jgi:hypothetical protein
VLRVAAARGVPEFIADTKFLNDTVDDYALTVVACAQHLYGMLWGMADGTCVMERATDRNLT